MSGYLPPDYIDNQRATLAEVLERAIRELGQRRLDVATGYFHPRVWRWLREAFWQLESFRLLLGRAPEREGAGLDRLDLKQYFRRKLREELEALPLDRDHLRLIEDLIEFLKQESVEVRLYAKPFLHAKAYIFPEIAIVGSSNLTPAGLTHNSELNLVRKEEAVARSLQEWFEGFWQGAEDYKPELIELLEASKFGGRPYSPYEVFLKVLYEYFKDRLPEPEALAPTTGIELASFQREGTHWARTLLRRHRGVLIADAVGLGKTYIGLALLEHFLLKERRRGQIPKGLVVCPAQLRELLWKPKLEEHGILAAISSQEEMGRRDFDWGRFSHYDVVLVDESHNFRNPGTRRYQHLLRLISSGNRDKLVILMTATPINNSIWDLYHQLMLITRGSDAYFRDWGIRDLYSFFRKVAQGEAEIFELLEQTTVRRSRYDLKKRQEAGERITLGEQEICFPERVLRTVSYDLTSTYQGFYGEIAQQIEALQLASYNLEAFKRDGQQREIDRNNALIAILKTLWLKRLESSVQAFAESVRNQQRFQRRFFELLLQNKLLSARDYKRLLALEADEKADPEAVEALWNELPEVSVQEYDLRAIRRAVELDLCVFDSILKKLQSILEGSRAEPRRDAKLERLKSLLEELPGEKVLVFTYYQDTARYLYEGLTRDREWQSRAGISAKEIGLITGDTKPKERELLIRRFAPRANALQAPSGEGGQPGPSVLRVLLSTDVLSEGQNLQDARICINYDLHWNPVRMIQRAGRIDRMGSPHATIEICNFFPEEGLEELLGLVERLQRRIADIDRTVGLDASVLGETISQKSLEELRRLRAGDPTVLDDLEREAELLAADEMRLPLLVSLQELGEERIKELPLGIHSGKRGEVEGVFFAFRAKDRHFWRFYPLDGEDEEPLTDKRKLFHWICCDRDEPRVLPPNAWETVFPLLERATGDVLKELEAQRVHRKVKEPLKGLSRKLYAALEQLDAWEAVPSEQRARLLGTLEAVPLKPFERDPRLRALWARFQEDRDVQALAEGLDAFFREHGLHAPPDEGAGSPATPERITAEDLRLVAYLVLSP